MENMETKKRPFFAPQIDLLYFKHEDVLYTSADDPLAELEEDEL